MFPWKHHYFPPENLLFDPTPQDGIFNLKFAKVDKVDKDVKDVTA